MANFITGLRIFLSIVLLFCPVFSVQFYALYLFAGLTDIIDGTVARKTNTVSTYGSNFDVLADFVFFLICFIKLIPKFNIAFWMYIWFFVIFIIKIINIVCGFIIRNTFVSLHTFMNKLSGFLLFVLPLTVFVFDIRYSIAIVCAIATFAAIEEGHYIRTGKGELC